MHKRWLWSDIVNRQCEGVFFNHLCLSPKHGLFKHSIRFIPVSLRFILFGSRFILIGLRFTRNGLRFIPFGFRFILFGLRFILFSLRFILIGCRFIPKKAIGRSQMSKQVSKPQKLQRFKEIWSEFVVILPTQSGIKNLYLSPSACRIQIHQNSK